jgi:hypothetical protein
MRCNDVCATRASSRRSSTRSRNTRLGVPHCPRRTARSGSQSITKVWAPPPPPRPRSTSATSTATASTSAGAVGTSAGSTWSVASIALLAFSALVALHLLARTRSCNLSLVTCAGVCQGGGQQAQDVDRECPRADVRRLQRRPDEVLRVLQQGVRALLPGVGDPRNSGASCKLEDMHDKHQRVPARVRVNQKHAVLCTCVWGEIIGAAGSHGRVQAVAAQGALRLLQAQPQDRDQGGPVGRVRHNAPCCVWAFAAGCRCLKLPTHRRNIETLLWRCLCAGLASYVSEHSQYHHGEASLMGTIIGMAQNFVGGNNVNLLFPAGQFGTRLMGGADAASPRYIFTRVRCCDVRPT